MDELRTALEIATEEELQDLTAILFSRKFNPLDYVNTPEPIEIQSQDRQAWLDSLEERFRFLAADGITVLRGKTKRVTYREAIIQVCKHLKIPYSTELTTIDLEAEVFLHLLGKVWRKLPKSEQHQMTLRIQRHLAQSELKEPLPLTLQRDPLGLIFKAGSAFALTSVVQPFLLKHIARQFAAHFASYHVARQAAIKGSAAAVSQFNNYVTLHMARRGMALSAARYGAIRSTLTFLGPVMWTWFLADLGWRAIATNYGRIIPTIFALAQIRLTRTECWELA
ncbi:YaaW family protein [Mastigocoleus sp. MO_188.B34]|uniref:YaaW family protein n=1 Tax=Mastigocoleus sp. MO_188.B34 TaxID=3036635 RepID=UPI002616E3A2|nr:YaaW family protein [Mastigocoleus sp. MO_188.B34]MDJ0695615.1 YaaW family protein [Mastigocoleus sp. MO_188.B34]